MKNILKITLSTVLFATVFTSCMKEGDDSWMRDQERELGRIDSTNKAQALILKPYAEAQLENPKLDTVSGIWYELLSPNTDESFNFLNGGNLYTNFFFKAKYEGKLVSNGNVFDSNTTGADFTANGVIFAWQKALFPKSTVLNGQTIKIGGITEKGLKKGGKIRIITPSTNAYDNVAKGNIPPNSPLDFTIEILEIK